MTVYRVIGSSSEYADYSEWTVAGFLSLEDAAKCREFLREYKCAHGWEWHEGKERDDSKNQRYERRGFTEVYGYDDTKKEVLRAQREACFETLAKLGLSDHGSTDHNGYDIEEITVLDSWQVRVHH